VRAYIGLDDQNQFRLLFTPVEGASIENNESGTDIILEGQFTRGSDTSGYPVLEGNYILNFTHPCPNFCSLDSPLFHE
jgi:hypothetical protein